MRHAAALFAQTVFFAATLGGINGFIDRGDDVSHRNVGCFAGQGVAAAGASGGFDQLVAAQFAKQLLQVGQRNLLALADRRQGDGAAVLAQGQINHGSYGKTAFGGQTHGKLL